MAATVANKPPVAGYTGGVIKANGDLVPPPAPSRTAGIFSLVPAGITNAVHAVASVFKKEVTDLPESPADPVPVAVQMPALQFESPDSQPPSPPNEVDVGAYRREDLEVIGIRPRDSFMPALTTSQSQPDAAPHVQGLPAPELTAPVVESVGTLYPAIEQPVENNPFAALLNPELKTGLTDMQSWHLDQIETKVAEHLKSTGDKELETVFRDALTHKFMLAFAENFKEEFTTNTIDFNAFQTVSDKLRALQWNNGNRNKTVLYDPKMGLICETFGPNFVQARADVLRKNQAQSLSALTQTQMETLEWAEKQFNELTTALQVEIAIPSAPLEDVVAPVSTPIVEQPAPAPAILTTKVAEKRITYVSYIDSAFKAELEKGDAEAWKALPDLVKRDAILHSVYIGSIGKAEKIAERVLNTSERLTKSNQKIASTKMGQSVLDFYYSEKIKDYHIFARDLKALPMDKEPLFLDYFRELAEKAGEKIEGWDKDWAFHHWKKDAYLHFSLQALERFLHTN